MVMVQIIPYICQKYVPTNHVPSYMTPIRVRKTTDVTTAAACGRLTMQLFSGRFQETDFGLF